MRVQVALIQDREDHVHHEHGQPISIVRLETVSRKVKRLALQAALDVDGQDLLARFATNWVACADGVAAA